MVTTKFKNHNFIKATFLSLSLGLSHPSLAADFKGIWGEILKNSHEMAAADQELKASEYALSRSQWHWAPQASFNAQAYSTNDPASNFFGLLSQRSVTQNDFAPQFLNQPGYQSFQSVGLGVNLPLYEGGRGVGGEAIQAHQVDVQKLKRELKLRETYASTFRSYSLLVIAKKTARELLDLKSQTEKMISRYSIGSESNPVGYSGILGLRGLLNRISAELNSIELLQTFEKTNLSEKTSTNLQDLIPSESDVMGISLEDAFLSQQGESIRDELAMKKEHITTTIQSLERSRFLPTIGLFGNHSLTHGARNTASGTTAGIYLSWSLFQPQNLYRESEQEALARASQFEKKQMQQMTSIARSQLKDSERILTKNLELLKQSEQILKEQVKTTSKLFQSGALTAIQLSEVYNRRADLILNLKMLEEKWIEMKSSQIQMSAKSSDEMTKKESL